MKRDDELTCEPDSSTRNVSKQDRKEQPAANPWALSSSGVDRADDNLSSEVSSSTLPNEAELPQQIGRYRVQRRLGRGGFAVVYLARDQDLDRYVAIKVPRPDRFRNDVELSDFVEEARKTAQFDHRGIVRVYDVQREPSLVYIVEQYIDGADLAAFSKSNSLSTRDVAQLMIAIADAVGYAHERGFVHRDLKPSNILIDREGTPYVADFGLAIHETARHALLGQLAGTYPYMSPEQARGESHRLDGRSDIWSLGVILYQLLTSRLPFKGKSRDEVLSSIVKEEPSPLNLYDHSLAGELSRICHACLAKRVGDRFQSADELIADLREWLSDDSDSSQRRRDRRRPLEIDRLVEPQGLRTFEPCHAEFFPQLLPGPYDREGLPKSIRFWLTRIESRRASETFSVGLMYGPSGCGKSSIVQAGILPRLSDQVLPIVVDAAAGDTTSRVLNELYRVCPTKEGGDSLTDRIASLREAGGSSGRKVLIVIDQFEQFLRAHEDHEIDQLVTALRQADGAGIQVLILVRDDFYGSVNRFFNRLEIPILEGRNAALVDPFEAKHASEVLMAFGRAFGQVPQLPTPATAQNRRFVQRAIERLDEDGKICCVRIAVFAEMMKSRPWNEQSLRDVGGIDGLGMTFLQEQFSRKSSPPNHRIHETAVRRVLGELIEDDVELKGQTRSHQELLNASGYQHRPADFESVLRILDGELRLITASEQRDPGSTDGETQAVGYQLAHDYLTHAIREWVSQHQMETRRGRAQLCLDQRSKAYAQNGERRNLPSLSEFLSISSLTKRRVWTPRQQAVMREARNLHLRHAVIAIGLLLVAGSTLCYWREKNKAVELVNHLMLADPENVPGWVNQLSHSWCGRSVLEDKLEDVIANDKFVQQVKLSVALLETGPQQRAFLESALTDDRVPYRYLPMLREAVLGAASKEFTDWLRDAVMRSDDAPGEDRLRAAIALVAHDTTAEYWSKLDRDSVARQLIRVDSELQTDVRDSLRPIQSLLTPSLLSFMFAKENLGEVEKVNLARALAEFARHDAVLLAHAVSLATAEQYPILFAPFADLRRRQIKGTMTHIAGDASQLAWKTPLAVGKQRAGAALALLSRGDLSAVPLVLHVEENPESLTQFIHGLRIRNIESRHLLDCLDRFTGAGDGAEKATPSLLFGLLLALGEYELKELPRDRRGSVLERVEHWYASHPSSGVHGAAGWLLRRWERDDAVRRVDQQETPYEEGSEWFTIKIDATPSAESNDDVTTLFLTFVVFEPGKFVSGGAKEEMGWNNNEQRMKMEMPRRFAILDRELTHREVVTFENFSGGYNYPRDSDEHAYHGLHWYDSVRYCRWLSKHLWEDWDQAYIDENDLTLLEYSRDRTPAAKGAPRDWPVDLDRPGFRLPTESEWEYACRGGMISTWSFGYDAELFDRYAWNKNNSEMAMLPKTRRPNLRGLFDMYGNCREWCHDKGGFRREKNEPTIDNGGKSIGPTRVTRGGGFKDPASASRSGSRDFAVPSQRHTQFGLRIVMTLKSKDD